MNPNWSEYEKLVMFRLDEMQEDIRRLEAAQLATRIEVAKSASLWGAVGGVVTGVIAIFFRKGT